MSDQDDDEYELEDDEGSDDEESDEDDEDERVESDEDDYNFNTRVDSFEWYECRNVGCVGKKNFRHNLKEWFEENGMDSPTKCKPCGDWNEEQEEIGPITVTCHWCQQTSWQVGPQKRISYKKYTGRWDADFQICYRCLEYPGRKFKMEYRLAQKMARDPFIDGNGEMQVADILARVTAADEEEKERIVRERDTSLLRALLKKKGLEATPECFDVPDDLVFYESIMTPQRKIVDHGRTRLTHILKEGHEWKSKFGTEDPEAILHLARHIALSVEDHILQFKEYQHSILKYDTEHQLLVVLQKSDRSPTGYMLITTYQMEMSSAIGKIKNKKWRTG